MPDELTPSVKENLEPQIRLLRILCILTFVGSGGGLFSYGFIGINPEWFYDSASKGMNQEMLDLLKLIISPGRTFLLVMAALHAFSFIGALLMWRLRKLGFHLYSFSQILILITPLLFIRGFPTAGINVILTLLFIVAYARFLKMMH